MREVCNSAEADFGHEDVAGPPGCAEKKQDLKRHENHVAGKTTYCGSAGFLTSMSLSLKHFHELAGLTSCTNCKEVLSW